MSDISLDNQVWEHQHATDPPQWWCNGRFYSIPVRFVGLGHPARRSGWPVYRCLECGDEIFIEGLTPHDTHRVPDSAEEGNDG